MNLRLLVALLGTATAGLFGQSVTLPEVSPKASVAQTVGITDITVTYHRPSVAQRPVWGALVPYGFNNLGYGTAKAAPWRAGANENTVISFQHDVLVEGHALKAGAYGLFMALTSDGSVTVIFSHDSGAWGSFFYDDHQDALRVLVHWEEAPFHEQLTYDFSDVTKTSAVLALSWEKKRIPIALQVETDANVTASLKQELEGPKRFQYQAWVAASSYLEKNNRDLPLALEWATVAVEDRSVGVHNYETLSNQAQILEKLGRTAAAKVAMDEALRLGTAGELHQYGRELLARGQPALALAVFKLNAELHPDVWPVHYGLARGYSAVGDYPAALAALLKAEKEIPSDDVVNAAAIRENLAKLRRGQNIN